MPAQTAPVHPEPAGEIRIMVLIHDFAFPRRSSDTSSSVVVSAVYSVPEIKMYNSVAPYKPHKYELARPLNNEGFCTKSSGSNSVSGLSLHCSGYAVPLGKLD